MFSAANKQAMVDAGLDYVLGTKHRDLPAPITEWVNQSPGRFKRSFRMSKSDLKARPIFHRKQDSIRAHLAVVMVALAVGHHMEQMTGLSLKPLVRTLKKYRTCTVEVNGQTLHAASPVPEDVKAIIDQLIPENV